MKENRPYRLIISGGGTGGHIYPAIAIANIFCLKHPYAEVLFVGAKRKMEMTLVSQNGYKISGLWISGLIRGKLFLNLMLPFKVIVSIIEAIRIVNKFKPDVAVGTGGYASLPLMLVANLLRIPSLLQEQNSYPGITNRILAKRASSICVAYPNMELFFPPKKVFFTGNPVRKDIANIESKRNEALNRYNFTNENNTLLVLGGSGGASTINESIFIMLDQIISSGTQLIWQTGKSYYAQLKSRVGSKDLTKIRLFGFLMDMDLAYAASDIVISRAGAISISELCLAKKTAILIPSPNVADDHQTKNAMALVAQNAVVMIRDDEAREKLVPQALNLLNDKPRCNILIENIGKIGRPNATEEIVDEIDKLLE